MPERLSMGTDVGQLRLPRTRKRPRPHPEFSDLLTERHPLMERRCGEAVILNVPGIDQPVQF
jgi:hypothetical protein